MEARGLATTTADVIFGIRYQVMTGEGISRKEDSVCYIEKLSAKIRNSVIITCSYRL